MLDASRDIAFSWHAWNYAPTAAEAPSRNAATPLFIFCAQKVRRSFRAGPVAIPPKNTGSPRPRPRSRPNYRNQEARAPRHNCDQGARQGTRSQGDRRPRPQLRNGSVASLFEGDTLHKMNPLDDPPSGGFFVKTPSDVALSPLHRTPNVGGSMSRMRW